MAEITFCFVNVMVQHFFVAKIQASFRLVVRGDHLRQIFDLQMLIRYAPL